MCCCVVLSLVSLLFVVDVDGVDVVVFVVVITYGVGVVAAGVVCYYCCYRRCR